MAVTLDDQANDGPPALSGRDVSSTVENLIGGPAGDTLAGSQVANRLEGGGGNDTLRGNGGRRRPLGGAGDDTIEARDGIADTIDCGPGSDTARVDPLRHVAGCERVILPDDDGDGTSPPADCNDADASIRPGAPDRPVTASIRTATAPTPRSPGPARRPIATATGRPRQPTATTQTRPSMPVRATGRATGSTRTAAAPTAVPSVTLADSERVGGRCPPDPDRAARGLQPATGRPRRSPLPARMPVPDTDCAAAPWSRAAGPAVPPARAAAGSCSRSACSHRTTSARSCATRCDPASSPEPTECLAPGAREPRRC